MTKPCPLLPAQEGRYQRWMIVNTLTSKWLDITIHHLPASPAQTDLGLPTANCKMYLVSDPPTTRWNPFTLPPSTCCNPLNLLPCSLTTCCRADCPCWLLASLASPPHLHGAAIVLPIPSPSSHTTHTQVAKDGVYLSKLPRLPRATNHTRAPGVSFNSIQLAPGNR